MWLGFGDVFPRNPGITRRNRGGRGHANEYTAVGTTGLEQKHTQTGVFRQPVGDDTPGRAGAHDNVVVGS